MWYAINSKKYWLLVFLVIASVTFSCRTNEDKILPKKRNLVESVYSSVLVQPDSLYKVYAAVGGILSKNFVEEGDLVLKNKPILQIVNSTPKLNSENAKLTLELARENLYGSTAVLKGIKDEIKAAKLNYKNDSVNYFRQQFLWNKKIGSQAEYDAKKLRFQLSKNNLQLLETNYYRTKNELETAVKKAENSYKTSLITTKDFTINSMINGKVYALHKNVGEIVSIVEPLASIGSATNFVLEMLVDEVDIVKIVNNQRVIISLDVYNGEVFEGNVVKIYPKKDERNQTFKVEALFNTRPKILYPGLSGEANIIIAEKENVLTIPKEYLIDDSMVKTDEGIVNVTTGLQNLEFIEIFSGISENTYIYKPN